MPEANFIADPWEWPGRVSYLDNQWQDNYAVFRTRLHWVLLWFDEVWIQDSFAIYNRQFEHWFETARTESLTQQDDRRTRTLPGFFLSLGGGTEYEFWRRQVYVGRALLAQVC